MTAVSVEMLKNKDDLNEIGKTLCIFNLNVAINTHLLMFLEQGIILVSQIKNIWHLGISECDF